MGSFLKQSLYWEKRCIMGDWSSVPGILAHCQQAPSGEAVLPLLELFTEASLEWPSEILSNPQWVMNHHWGQLDSIWDNKQESCRAREWPSWVFPYLARSKCGQETIRLIPYSFWALTKWTFRLLVRRKPLSVIVTEPLSSGTFSCEGPCQAALPWLSTVFKAFIFQLCYF